MAFVGGCVLVDASSVAGYISTAAGYISSQSITWAAATAEVQQ
jgi:hypothetical protein